MSEKPGRPRRGEYSKAGCRECKRRKIKCDEGKPSCYQCSRLNKECKYPGVGERILRVSKKLLDKSDSGFMIQLYQPPKKKVRSEEDDSTGESQPSPEQPESGENGTATSTTSPEKTGQLPQLSTQALPPSTGPISDPLATTPNHPFSDFNPITPSSGLDSFSPRPFKSTSIGNLLNDDQIRNGTPSSIGSELYDVNDLNIIASDLNNLVNDIMFTSKFDKSEAGLDEYANNFNKSFLPHERIPDEKIVPTHIPIDYIKVSNMEERFYLEDFYYEFAILLNPWGCYHHDTQTYTIPIRDIMLMHASSAPFLMAAILAQGAKTSYDRKRLQKDNDAYHYFLSTCLRLLAPAVTKSSENMARDELSSNIEAVLLTMLVLTAANAATSTQNWRPHLRGAKGLIVKSNNKKIRLSKTFIICKFWFIALEVLAGVSSRLGGTLKLVSELDSVVNLDHPYELKVLKQYGVSLSNGFNVFFGYHNDCLALLRDLIKLLNLKRDEGAHFVADDTHEYLRLLSGFHSQLNIEFIDRRCILNAYPSSPVLVDAIRFDNKEFIVSWMDLSQQSFCYASIITILTRFFKMPYNSPQVQKLNTQLIALVSFLKDCPGIPEQSLKNSVMMIQWPMLVAGINCMQENEKYVLMKFFRISAQLGSGSAEIALKRIVRVWEKRTEGEEIDTEEDNDLDVVSY